MNSNVTLFLIFFSFSLFGQTEKNGVSIELSIPHSGNLPWINDNSSYDKAYLLIHNNSESSQYFYKDWCSYGYFSPSLEIKHNDSIYKIRRSEKLWYRNFHDYHTVLSGETLVIEFKIVDSVSAANTEEYNVFGHGWVGFPDFSDTVEVRVVYEMRDLKDSIPSENIARLNYRPDPDYKDYLDGDIEVSPESDPIPMKYPLQVIIFHEPLVSEWQKVLLLH